MINTENICQAINIYIFINKLEDVGKYTNRQKKEEVYSSLKLVCRI